MAPLQWSAFLVLLLLISCVLKSVRAQYVVDDSAGLGRRFDGIGGLSGGGVSRWICALL